MAETALNNTNQRNSSFSPTSGKKFTERPKIIVYSELDELGLDPYEFRVYGHIARRGNCFATLDKIAATCRMSVRKVQYALKILEESRLIGKEKRNGRTNKFVLLPPSRWLGSMNVEKLEAIRDRVRKGERTTCSTKQDSVSNKNSGDFDPSDSDELDEAEVPY